MVVEILTATHKKAPYQFSQMTPWNRASSFAQTAIKSAIPTLENYITCRSTFSPVKTRMGLLLVRISLTLQNSLKKLHPIRGVAINEVISIIWSWVFRGNEFTSAKSSTLDCIWFWNRKRLLLKNERKYRRVAEMATPSGKHFFSKMSESAGGRPAIAICDYDLTSSDPTVIF